MTLNISLTPELEAYVQRKLASGLYSSASEVVREALRRMFTDTQGCHKEEQTRTSHVKKILPRRKKKISS